MKSLKYILVISTLILVGMGRAEACGPDLPDNPNYILMFRSCSPELERQWHEGCRFQDYEKDENSLLWQKITSTSIPTDDIKKLVYTATLSDLGNCRVEALRITNSLNGFANPGTKRTWSIS